MYLPQSIQTTIELTDLVMVPSQIISPQSNKPVIGCIMDCVVGSSLITRKDKLLNEHEVYKILSSYVTFNGEIPKPHLIKPSTKHTPEQKFWTGRQIFSLIIPKINFFKSDDDENVIIHNGKLTQGICNKGVIGTGGGSLVHIINNDLGQEHTKDFLNNIQRMINFWLLKEGFSIGIGDTIPETKIKNNIRNIINKAKGDVQNLVSITRSNNDKIQNTTRDELENSITNILNKARDETGGYATKSLDNQNSLNNMVVSGSKGNFINISQIMACVTGDTEITLEDGFNTIPIKSLDIESKILTVNPNTKDIQISGFKNYFILDTSKNDKELYQINTISGRKIICTDDHPFLTKNNIWKKACNLNENDLVCIHPSLDSIKNENIIKEEIIISKTQFFNYLKTNTNMNLSRIYLHYNILKDNDLLPLTTKNTKLPIISRFIGHLYTDGNFALMKDKKCYRMRLTVSKSDIDGMAVKNDFHNLGYEIKMPKNRTTTYQQDSKIITQTTKTFETKGYLASLFAVFGICKGNKIIQPTPIIPNFIMNGSKLVKREFLGSFFGGDGGSIHCNKNNMFTITRFRKHKAPEHEESLLYVYEQVKMLLLDFDIKISTIKKENTNPKSGNSLLALTFVNSEKNILNFISNIGYRYAVSKQNKAINIQEYIRYKESLKNIIRKFRKDVINIHKNNNYTQEKLMNIFNKKYNLNFGKNVYSRIILKKKLYQDDNHDVTLQKNVMERFKIELLSFTTFTKNYCNINNDDKINQFLWLPIKINKLDKNKIDKNLLKVYDFETISNNHSFIANGFVTHNCVGPQSVTSGTKRGRISYGFENRTMPHFQKYDDGPKSRGFVENSYMSGLNPAEFFFHAMSE